MYAIFDFGNTLLKVGIFSSYQKIEKTIVFSNKTPCSEVVRRLKNYKINKIYFGTSCPNKAVYFINELKKLKTFKTYIIQNHDFESIIKIPTACKKDEIGLDIYSLSLFLSEKHKQAIGFCLGTAYVGVIVKNNELLGCSIAPSVMNGIREITKSTDLIKITPISCMAWVGVDTATALEAGCLNSIAGFIDQFVQHAKNKFKISNFIVTGGDSSICNRMKNVPIVDNVIIHGYDILINKYLGKK